MITNKNLKITGILTLFPLKLHNGHHLQPLMETLRNNYKLQIQESINQIWPTKESALTPLLSTLKLLGYLSNYATRFQKFHFWSNMVNLFNLEVPFLSEI